MVAVWVCSPVDMMVRSMDGLKDVLSALRWVGWSGNSLALTETMSADRWENLQAVLMVDQWDYSVVAGRDKIMVAEKVEPTDELSAVGKAAKTALRAVARMECLLVLWMALR